MKRLAAVAIPKKILDFDEHVFLSEMDLYLFNYLKALYKSSSRF